MNIETETISEVLVIRPDMERVDASSAAEFRETVLSAVSEGSGRVVLDLEAVGFFDSSGISAVIATRKALGEDGVLAIAAAQRDVALVFRLTRLDRIFPMKDSVEEALEAIQ